MRKALACLALLALCSSIVAAPPVKVKGMKIADFEKLPDDTMLDLDGRMVTKRAFLAEMRAGRASPGPAGKPTTADAEKAKARFEQNEKSRLEAQNAAVLAKAKSLSSGIQAAEKPGMGEVKNQTVKFPPTITSVDLPYLEPGVHFTVRGVGFGGGSGSGLNTPEVAGRMFVSGSFGSLSVFRFTGLITWADHRVTGLMPTDLVAPGQTVTVLVETKEGARSAPFSVEFRPRRAIDCTLLSPASVSGPRGPHDTCNMDYSGNPDLRCEHRSVNGEISVGVDRVSLNLKNGWVMDSYGGAAYPMGNASIQAQITFIPGAISMNATYTFAAINDWTWWHLWVCATGPVDGRPRQ